MLRAFGHRVAMCCDMFGVVGSSLKMVKCKPTTPNTSQHVATVAKRTQHVAPSNVAICRAGMLRSSRRGFTESISIPPGVLSIQLLALEYGKTDLIKNLTI